jgi:hypothetical protein
VKPFEELKEEKNLNRATSFYLCDMAWLLVVPFLLLLGGGGFYDGLPFAAGQTLLSGDVAVSTVAGRRGAGSFSDGIGSSAAFDSPLSIALNSGGSFAVVVSSVEPWVTQSTKFFHHVLRIALSSFLSLTLSRRTRPAISSALSTFPKVGW